MGKIRMDASDTRSLAKALTGLTKLANETGWVVTSYAAVQLQHELGSDFTIVWDPDLAEYVISDETTGVH
jgi:hypothetical protein